MRVIVFGARGQVGRELQRRMPSAATVEALDKEELDICDPTGVLKTVREYSPDLVINCAAYTAVDEAESDHEAAFAVNSTGARNIALAAQATDCRIVHISTDFIFDGEQGRPYRTDDEARPLSVYGRSKLDGEEAVIAVCGESAVIVRTSWIYSAFGDNFVKTMLTLMQQRPRLGVVCDQIGCPTWAGSLAGALWELGLSSEISGIVHWTDSGVASWFDFAVAIQEIALDIGSLQRPILIEPIPTNAYPTPATRPPFSVLDTSASTSRLETPRLHWRAALRKMLEDLARGKHE